MSAGAGFGSDGGDAAMQRCCDGACHRRENPHEEGFTFRSIGESTRAPRRATIMQGRKEYMDRCSEDWTPRSDRRGIFHTFRSPGGGWVGGWEAVIDFEFKTLPTGRKSTRKRGKVFSITGGAPGTPLAPLAAADQDALRRSRNDRYFEPLLILPLRENSDGGGGAAALFVLANKLVRSLAGELESGRLVVARSCSRVFPLTTF